MDPTVLVDNTETRIGGHARRSHMVPEPANRNVALSIEYEWRQLYAGAVKSGHFLGSFDRKHPYGLQVGGTYLPIYLDSTKAKRVNIISQTHAAIRIRDLFDERLKNSIAGAIEVDDSPNELRQAVLGAACLLQKFPDSMKPAVTLQRNLARSIGEKLD